MKHFSFISAAAAATLMLAASCSDSIETYNGQAGIYFAMPVKSNSVNVDTMYCETSELPFIITNAKDSTFYLKVKILGPVASHDRNISVRIVEEETDLLPEDMDPLQESYPLYAGQVFGGIPLKFHRAASLEGEIRTLTLELVENGDFSLPVKLWRNSSTEYVNVIRHTITISDKYVQLPGFSEAYFGPFSEKKMKLMLELFDMELKDFSEPLSYVYAKALGQKLDRYLKEMEAKGEPVMEEDGITPMRAGDYIYN